MMTIYSGGVGYPLKVDDYYIRELASGLDELIFQISTKDDDFALIKEEAQIQDRGLNTYLVKQIDAGNDSAKVVCQIDIDAWKSAMYESYTNGSATVYATINSVKPSGWTVVDNSGISTRRTIPTSDTAQPYTVTAWQIVEAACNTWPVRVRIDTAAKRLTIINPATYQSLGAFATKELNLRTLTYKGKSQGFVTRLYAEGAEGLNFASINGGKKYVDNNDYKGGVIISSFWKDERYTDAASLLADARTKLAAMARPQSSYDCDVIDLAKTNPDMYAIQDFSLFSMVTLMDNNTQTAVPHQVVERWDYPHYPTQNKIVLSTSVPKIQSQVASVVSSIDTPTSTFNQLIQAVISNQTSLITGNQGGYVVLHDTTGDGKPNEILIMDTNDITTASKVWRWNASGLGYSSSGYNGPYKMAWTIDGVFNADFITTGTINANLATIINIDADNINTGTLSASRIAANSIAVSKLTGSISNGGWKIDLDAGTMSLGELAVGKITGSLTDGTWGIDFTNGTMTIGNIAAGKITSGTLPAARIGNNSVTVAKLAGQITQDDWELDLTNGTLTIGTISANQITTGTLDASKITVSNLVVDDVLSVSSDKLYRTRIQAGLFNFDYSTNSGTTYLNKATFGVVARKYINVPGTAYNGELQLKGYTPNAAGTALEAASAYLEPGELSVRVGSFGRELNVGSASNSASGTIYINGAKYTLQRLVVKNGSNANTTIAAYVYTA